MSATFAHDEEAAEAPEASARTPIGESEEGARERKARKAGRALFGGLDPAEAAVRAARKRAENAAERKAAADLDRLSVLARAGVAAATVLTYQAQVDVLRAMLKKAVEDGSIQAAVFLRDWLVKLGGSEPGDEDTDVLDPSQMTPAQRAAVRSRLLAELAQDEQPAPERIP